MSDVGHVLLQSKIPVAIRLKGKGVKLRVKLPFDYTNRTWLNTIGKTSVTYFKSEKQWELPNSWFDKFVDAALEKYGKLYVIQPHNEQEKCSPACMNAKGHICQCSCMGEHHGAGNNGSWFEVSNTFSTRWKGEQIACRLMTRKATNNLTDAYFD